MRFHLRGPKKVKTGITVVSIAHNLRIKPLATSQASCLEKRESIDLSPISFKNHSFLLLRRRWDEVSEKQFLKISYIDLWQTFVFLVARVIFFCESPDHLTSLFVLKFSIFHNNIKKVTGTKIFI